LFIGAVAGRTAHLFVVGVIASLDVLIIDVIVFALEVSAIRRNSVSVNDFAPEGRILLFRFLMLAFCDVIILNKANRFGLCIYFIARHRNL